MFSTSIEARIEYVPGDPLLINSIVSQLKSQGVFDQFRKECISDVDTKPAYQNLCHRVDGRVATYLSDVKWGPNLNKNQLREKIRKHVNECTFVDSGIVRIVDQLVNPRINTVLVPKVEDTVYAYLGIERPENERLRSNPSASEKPDVLPPKNSDGYDEKPQPVTAAENDRVASSPNQQTRRSSVGNIFPDFKNGVERKPLASLTNESTNPHGMNACSDIDSDEDDMSPPFEPHEKSDDEASAASDYSMDVSDTKYDVKPEPAETVKSETGCPTPEPPAAKKPDIDGDRVFKNLERICGEESMDSATSSCTDKMSSRKPSYSLDLPNTPTINYETSDESQDNQFRKNLRRDSVQTELCAPDTNSMDSFVEKGIEGDQVSPTISTDDAYAMKPKHEDMKDLEDAAASKTKRTETKSSDSKDSKRDHKYSSSKKDKYYKSDRDRKSSRDKDKERSNHDSRSHKDESSRSRKDHSKDRDKNKHSERSSRDGDSKHRDSSKASLSSDKHRLSSSSRSKTDDSKDDRKKKSSSSSRPDSEKDRERSKHRKEESTDVKKNKTQCSSDKKSRSDRRSSDRDSSGPSSSNSSSQRSSSKADKEKHRHSSSSSSSSSHKTKKNVGTKDGDRAADALFDTMLSMSGSASVSDSTKVNTKDTNIENTSSLLDILNGNSDSNASRANVSCKENRKSSGSRDGKKETESSRSRKHEQSRISSSASSRKNSLQSDGSSKVDGSDSEGTKPKIARNAADIHRIMGLRKQYEQKEPRRSSVESEIEHTEGDSRKSIGEVSDTAIDSLGDCKLKIKRIDSHYQLINGACTLSPVQNHQTLANYDDVDSKDGNIDHRIEDSKDEMIVKLNASLQRRDRQLNGSLKDSTVSEVDAIDMKKHGCDVSRTISSVSEENDEVRYFEPPKLNTDFIQFVAERVREYEEMYLENFSVHLKCPERCDYIFENALGATVKRKCGASDAKSSPFKYNSEIIDSKVGNEKGIMMRIKKTVPENESFSLPSGIGCTNGLPDEGFSEFPTVSNKMGSAKRKTLGVKRRLSNHGKVPNAKAIKLNHTAEVNGALHLDNSIVSVPGSDMVDDERASAGSCETFDSSQASFPSTPDSQKSFGSNTNSVHSTGTPAPRVQKVLSKEQKRKQFYYDANDLYKPRPSFLLSSRRSRGLDPSNT